MDISKYRGTRYVKLADVEKDPIEGSIAGVTEGEYGLNIVLADGAIITLNKTSVGNLADAWGNESENWIAKTIRAFAGDIPFKGEFKRGVVVVPVSPPIKLTDDGRPFDAHEIPF